MKARADSPSLGLAVSLYKEMRPHTGMREWSFISGRTAPNTLPPTFSK